MSGKRTSEHKRGFTLIELLVVISIVVLLMAMLLPALSTVRRQAQAVVCRANTKQWGLFFTLYASEHEGQLVSSARLWYLGMYTYEESREGPLLCPAATKRDPTKEYDRKWVGGELVTMGWGGKSSAWWHTLPVSGPDDIASGSWRLLISSYGANAYISSLAERLQSETNTFGQEDESRTRAYEQRLWRQDNMQRPSTVPLLFDCASSGITPWETDQPPAYEGDFAHRAATTSWGPWQDTIRDACIDRHGNGSLNVAFADGSSGKVGLKELWTLKWHHSYVTSGPWTRAGGAVPEDWPLWMRRFEDY